MNRLKEIRLKKGLMIKDACKLIGVSACYLSQLETGYRQLSSSMLKKCCEAYKCKPNDILEYDDFILIDESNREFNEQDIKMLNLLKALSESDRDELNNFIEYLIFKHQKKIEAIENVNKKGNWWLLFL